MANYIVSMAVDGRIDVAVEADSVAEAFEVAKERFCLCDLSKMECVDFKPVNCQDEEGNILEDYKG